MGGGAVAPRPRRIYIFLFFNKHDNNDNNNDNNKVGEILNKRADFGIGAVKVQALIVNTLSASY